MGEDEISDSCPECGNSPLERFELNYHNQTGVGCPECGWHSEQ